MKVTFTKEAKQYITFAQETAVRKVIEGFKEDTDIKTYAKMAAQVASDSYTDFEIFKVEAEIAGNARVWDRYDEGTENIDVWLNIKAFDEFRGFYEIGAYVSDIWEISDNNRAEIKGHMFIRHYELAE